MRKIVISIFVTMKIKLTFLALILVCIGLKSCSDGSVSLPNVTGKAGEVVVVIEESDWNSSLGEVFKEILSEEVPALPQTEPVFDLVHIPEKAFTSIFKTHRNLIVMDFGSRYGEAKMNVQENYYSKPQTVISLVSDTRENMVSFLKANKQLIQDVLANAERQRIISNYKKYEKNTIRESITKNHGISMYFPKGYSLDLDTTNFVWVTYETPQSSQGIFIYYYPYVDSNAFEPASLIAVRDSLLKLYVSGPLDGSYMTTEKEHLIPEFSEYMYSNRYIAEIRGLWKLEGDFMGGPFVSHTLVDESRARIITVEGYVYAPKFDKRNYLRQVEAILYSLEL